MCARARSLAPFVAARGRAGGDGKRTNERRSKEERTVGGGARNAERARPRSIYFVCASTAAAAVFAEASFFATLAPLTHSLTDDGGRVLSTLPANTFCPTYTQ